MQDSTAPPRATRREWIGLAVIALPCLLYSMDLTVLNLAVPALSRDLEPSAAQLLWIIDIYGFMVAGMLITMGTLGDRIGRRRLLMIGATAFGIASAVAAFSTSAEMLILMRALHGIAGATLAPSTLSLIRNMFPDPAERATAVGIWISSFSAGAAIGPLVGGGLLEYFWWGSVFLINVPVMILLLVAAPSLLPEFRDPDARRLDLASALLSIAAVLATIYGLKQIAEHGPAAAPLLSIVVGLLLGAVFVRRQARLDDPLLDLRLFAAPATAPGTRRGPRISAFSAALGMYLLSCLVMFGIYIFIAQYLQLVLRLTPLEAGLWTVPWALSFIVGSTFTPRLARRLGPMPLIAATLAMSALGFGMLAFFGAHTGLGWFLVATVLMSLGSAPAFALATDLVISSVPPERAGSASALSETSGEFGGALGIALFGSLGAALYRASMDGLEIPGLSATALEAARSTLGAASAVARELPGAEGVALLATAREAFMGGMRLTAMIGAAVMLLMAVLAALASRRGAAAAGSPHRDAAVASEERAGA